MDMIFASRSVLPRSDVRVSHRDAMQLRACPLRYVLDEDASRQCAELLRGCPEMMTLEPEVLRLPAASFWLEWFAEQDDAGAPGHKLGCLVNAAEDGRSGTIRPYYTTIDSKLERLPGTIDFDLDGLAPTSTRASRSFRHPLFPHLEQVLSRAVMSMDAGWVSNIARSGADALTHRMRQEAEGSWFFLPYLLTFSVLLSSPNVLRARHTARRASGQNPERRDGPHDHVEVSLHLGEYAEPGVGSGDGRRSGRDTPRLHIVRGHYVSRGEKRFWRTSHLRGAGDWVSYAKTVNVKAGRRAR